MLSGYIDHLKVISLPLKGKLFVFEIFIDLYYFIFNFYQINKDYEIQIYNRLIIKSLISCQRINSIKNIKMLGEVLIYNLYYSLTRLLK